MKGNGLVHCIDLDSRTGRESPDPVDASGTAGRFHHKATKTQRRSAVFFRLPRTTCRALRVMSCVTCLPIDRLL